MKALAIREPYATLVATGRKTIEVRTWRTHYRGPLVIVASSSCRATDCARWGIDPQPSTVAALVELVDVRPMRSRDASAACMPRRDAAPWYWAWCLADARPLVRVPFTRSRVMTFEIDDRLVRAAMKGR